MTNSYNFQPVTNFAENYEGATRLFWKGMKLINRYADIRLSPEDRQDGISCVYLAVIEYEPTENETPLPELSQAYFGITSREQFRAGYNALQKMIYSSRTSGAPEYSQEYGLDGTAAKDELQEIELDLTLQQLLSEQFQELLELKLQGYSFLEMAEITGFTIDQVKKRQVQIKALIKEAFNVNTADRKKGTRKK